MCGPAVAPIIQYAALAIGVYSGVQAAQAQKAEAKYTARVNENNANMAEGQATDALQRGSQEEEMHRAAIRRMIGTQRATLAANNLQLDSGTAGDLTAETAGFGEQDALTIRANAAREAWGYKVQAQNYRNDGKMTLAAGNNAARGTMLTTAGNAFGSLSSMGAFSGAKKGAAAPTVAKTKSFSGPRG